MILLITLVILVILSTLGYTLSVRVAARRHRDQYIIDYGIARQACASGMKYALASAATKEFSLISRPNEPEFSDLFALSEEEYQKLLLQMEQYLAGQRLTDANDPRQAKDADDALLRDVNDRDSKTAAVSAHTEIPGPYGPPWPLAAEPVELEVGSARVTIEIEDENAKYPLGWAVLTDEKLRDKAGAGWTNFCEWMGYSSQEISELNKDLTAIGTAKPFKLEFKVETATPAAPAATPAVTRGRTSRTTGASASARRTVGKKPISIQEQIRTQDTEFSKLFHSSMLNSALLSRPSIESDSRRESAMKYLGIWGTRHVNINTAPRHVLEGALAFGSVVHAPKIADAIIQQRKIAPIADVNEVRKAVLGYSDVIEEARDYLVTSSTVFTIRVTAVRGAAKATAVAGVSREGGKLQPVAVICD